MYIRFPFKGTGVFYQLDPFSSDQSHQTLHVFVIRMLLFVASWQNQRLSVKRSREKILAGNVSVQSKFALKFFSDQTIMRLNPPLIRPTQTEVTSDHTTVRSNQISDPVILVCEDTVCVGRGLIRGHFRMGPQPGKMCDFTSTAAKYNSGSNQREKSFICKSIFPAAIVFTGRFSENEWVVSYIRLFERKVEDDDLVQIVPYKTTLQFLDIICVLLILFIRYSPPALL